MVESNMVWQIAFRKVGKLGLADIGHLLFKKNNNNNTKQNI